MRDDRIILGDLLEAISRIEKYAAGGRARFDSDELVQTWIVHHLQIVGLLSPSLYSWIHCWRRIAG